MNFLLLPVGLLFPTLAGWFVLSLLEWDTRTLRPVERWVMGSLLGLTLSMWIVFLANVLLHVPLSRIGFLSVEAIVTLVTGLAWYFTTGRRAASATDIVEAPMPNWQRIVMALACLWLVAKILPLAFGLVMNPPYLDDTLNNWNQRSKLFFVTQRVELRLMAQAPTEEPNVLSAYPPTVPLAKASLSAIEGSWDEGLSNSLHAVWLVTTLVLLYYALRRFVSPFWSMLGAYVLGGMPLYLVHGTNAYADVFVSAHVLTAIGLLLRAASAEDGDERRAFLRLFGFAVALLPMTKNEGLVLYLPAILLVAAGFAAWELRTRKKTVRQLLPDAAWIMGPVIAVALSWTTFKWLHHMPFGNGKSLTGLSVGWQPNVLYSVFINTFFEANWLLLFPLLLLLALVRWRHAFRTPLVILTAFLLTAYAMQLPLYMFTSLSNEALYQTGYARGLIHIVPVASLLFALLLQRIFSEQRD